MSNLNVLQTIELERSLWRPINGPVQDCPLAVCDGRTYSESSLVETDQVRRWHAGQTQYALFDPNMVWYYLSDQTDDEVLLFKNFDSMDGVTKCTQSFARET